MRDASASGMVGGCDMLSLSSKSSRSGWKDNERGRVSGVAGGDFKGPPPISPPLVSCDSPVSSSVGEGAGNSG